MTQSDTVNISGLKVNAVIGVFDWERAIEQTLVIDVSLKTDIGKAAESDDINDAINYKDVCDNITLWCQEAKAQLIEKLADLIAKNILNQYDTSEVIVTVSKPTAIKEADSVSVQIERKSNS